MLYLEGVLRALPGKKPYFLARCVTVGEQHQPFWGVGGGAVPTVKGSSGGARLILLPHTAGPLVLEQRGRKSTSPTNGLATQVLGVEKRGLIRRSPEKVVTGGLALSATIRP